MKPTEEQLAVIHSRAQRLRVNALAGTGKTTTLLLYARARPRARILYLSFNRRIVNEVKGKFPRNVTAKTTHSLALSHFNGRYRGQIGDVPIWQLAEIVNPPHSNPMVRTRFTRYARETLQSWFNSGDKRLGQKHLPDAITAPAEVRDVLDRHIDPIRVLHTAEQLWARMLDPRDDIPIPHDGYLKAFCLSAPQLPFDIILLDEAQDTNAAFLELLKRQSARLVMVGDKLQSIYAWRGAIDAMNAPADETCYLTQSFRFGSEIAEYADAVLGWIDPETPKLSGIGGEGYVGRLIKGQQLAILGRTNEGLFDMAAGLVLNRPDAKVGFVGGIQKYGLDLVEQIFKLFDARSVPDDPAISRFDSFDALKDYADNAGDQQLTVRAKLVDKYRDQIPEIIHRLRTSDVGDTAPNLISTAHKAKGMEFPQVVVCEDFAPMMDGGKPVDLTREAENASNPTSVWENARLRYVAFTRAQRALLPDDSSSQYVEWLRSLRERASHSSSA